jgi:hypothetical protein
MMIRVSEADQFWTFHAANLHEINDQQEIELYEKTKTKGLSEAEIFLSLK